MMLSLDFHNLLKFVEFRFPTKYENQNIWVKIYLHNKTHKLQVVLDLQ